MYNYMSSLRLALLESGIGVCSDVCSGVGAHLRPIRGLRPITTGPPRTRREEHRLDRLCESHRVERHVDAIGEPEKEARGATKSRTEVPADHEVGSTARHAAICDDGAEGSDCEVGDEL